MNIRVGFGFDVHQLVPNRKLILGGVEIPSEKGLEGHSDADVLLHAICDALLGAAALGDIGAHFPNTDERFKNIDSLLLLQQVHSLIKRKGYEVGNIDCTLVLERPKILPYINQMIEKISGVLQLSPENLSIKATTNESMGYIGRGEGAAAYAVCTIKSQS